MKDEKKKKKKRKTCRYRIQHDGDRKNERTK